MTFRDRADAGKELAKALEKYRGTDAVVYALPRGGAVTGDVVAKALALPLDLTIARKIGHPYNPEFAVCAVTEEGPLICNRADLTEINETWLAEEEARQRIEAKRRREVYLAGRAPLSARGKIALIVDDGIATGLTIHAALVALKEQKPRKIVIAVPCAPADAADTLRALADEVIVLTPEEEYLGAVGAYYESFPQVTDEEVVRILAR